MGFPNGSEVKNPLQYRRFRRCGFNPWLGRSPGGGNGNSLQYPCNKISNRGTWQATVGLQRWTGPSAAWQVALVLGGLFPRLCLGYVAGRLRAQGSVSLPLSRTHALTLLTHAGLSPGLWPIECETAHTASQQRFSVLPLSVFPRPENGRTGSGVPPLPESQKEETPHPGTDQQLRQYQLFFTLM